MHLSTKTFMSQRKGTLLRLVEIIIVNSCTVWFDTAHSFKLWLLNTSRQYEFKMEGTFLNKNIQPVFKGTEWHGISLSFNMVLRNTAENKQRVHLLPFNSYSFSFLLLISTESTELYIYIHIYICILSLLKWTLMLGVFPSWIYSETMAEMYLKFLKIKLNPSMLGIILRKKKKVPCLYVIHYGFWIPQGFWAYSNLVSCTLSVGKSKSYEEKENIFQEYLNCYIFLYSNINFRHIIDYRGPQEIHKQKQAES